jgi:hypothetical protein
VHAGGDYNYTYVVNSILWDNIGVLVNYRRYGGINIRYSVVPGRTGNGNVDADPLFVDVANGDYRLQPGSPAIDTGMNPADYSWLRVTVTDDIDDNPRPLDGDGAGAGTTGDGTDFDIGAYEFVH